MCFALLRTVLSFLVYLTLQNKNMLKFCDSY